MSRNTNTDTNANGITFRTWCDAIKLSVCSYDGHLAWKRGEDAAAYMAERTTSGRAIAYNPNF